MGPSILIDGDEERGTLGVVGVAASMGPSILIDGDTRRRNGRNFDGGASWGGAKLIDGDAASSRRSASASVSFNGAVDTDRRRPGEGNRGNMMNINLQWDRRY